VLQILVVACLAERVAEPLETLVKSITRGSASGLDVPGTLSQTVQTKLIRNLGSVHGIWQILLVGKDQEESVPKLILVQHTLQFFSGLDYTIAIVRVDDEDDTLGVLEVMPPQRPDLVLSSDIPYGELNVLVLDSLNIESDCWDSRDDFTQLELVEDSGLSSGVQTNHQDSHLLLPPQLIKQLRECKTHIGGMGEKSVL